MGKDLRTYLDKLQKVAPDELIRVKREVDIKFEPSQVVAKLESLNRWPTLIFENVKGFDIPIIMNLVASRKQYAIALDTTEKDLNTKFRELERNPQPTKLVKDAPVQEVVWTGKEVDLHKLPIPYHNEKDGGRYITPGIMVSKKPDIGKYNVGVHRHQLKGKNTLGIHLSTTAHAFRIYTEYEEKDKPMEIAIVLGHHPAFILGSLCFNPYDEDEYEICGAIMNEPLEVVKAKTVDLEVPAFAEIVIEGKILPHIREKEGPFGEYTMYYGPERMNPKIEVSAITMRKDAYYHDLLPGTAEHLLWGGTPRLSQIYETARRACPGVKDVYMPLSGVCRYICYIQIKKLLDGEPKAAIFGALAADPFIKYCVVVDEDVDIFDEKSVLHAIATRLIPEENVFIVKNCHGNPLDPTGRIGYTRATGTLKELDFIVTKIGIDATKPLKGFPEKLRVPGIEKIKLEDYLGH